MRALVLTCISLLGLRTPERPKPDIYLSAVRPKPDILPFGPFPLNAFILTRTPAQGPQGLPRTIGSPRIAKDPKAPQGTKGTLFTLKNLQRRIYKEAKDPKRSKDLQAPPDPKDPKSSKDPRRPRD